MSATRQAPLLQAEQEHHFETSRARAQEVEHGDPPRFACQGAPDLRPFDGSEDFFGREGTLALAPTPQLFDQPHHGLVRTDVLPRERADRRRLQPIGGTQHEGREAGNGVER